MTKIVVKTLPRNTGSKEIKPCIEIMDGKDFTMIYTDNPNYKGIDKQQRKSVQPEKFSMVSYKIGQANEMVIEVRNDKKPQQGVQVSGDLYFRLINSKNGKLICRFAMNTAFVNENNVYVFDKAGVDPDSILKSKDFDNNF